MEYMHCVKEGVVKLLLSLWTDTARCRGTLHDIERDLHLVDQRIGQIEVPTEVPRKPRGLQDHLNNWKGILLKYMCELTVCMHVCMNKQCSNYLYNTHLYIHIRT